MRRAFLAILVLSLLQLSSTHVFAGQGDGEYAGTYYMNNGGLAWIEITIRENGTFHYENFVDVGGVMATDGSWTEVRPGLLLANSFNRELVSTLKAEPADDPAFFQVVVLDEGSNAIPGATVDVWCGQEHHELSTDRDGQARLPDCHPGTIEVSLAGYTKVYHKVVAESPVKFVAHLAYVMDAAVITDELWCVYKDQLFVLGNPLEKQ